MKAIRVRDPIEFDRLRKGIDQEASAASHHFQLLKGLDEARGEYHREMNESNTFWYLTFIAHQSVVLSHLCRLYDQETSALSLARFLLTVRSNWKQFSKAAFQERPADNPNVEPVINFRAIDDIELDRELESVSKTDPSVSRLLSLRNAVIAHTGAKEVQSGSQQLFLPVQDIELLLTRARAITSKYSLLCAASMYGGIAGADDYKTTLRWLRKALTAHREQIDKDGD
jgi:hypothetical protein